MKAKHTGKTWHVNAISKGRIVGDENAKPPIDHYLITGANCTVAKVYRPADARLTAQAPLLYAACARLVTLIDESDEWADIASLSVLGVIVNECRAAIEPIEKKADTCIVCHGTGRDPHSDTVNWLPCSTCGGKNAL